ncbi:MAG: HD domain-containing protein [Ruminococcaceae bacterium]|nr:HD domain-containing protein [Oscillospiraceae bacterium]
MDLPMPVEKAIRRLEAHGYTAWAVGGCVRDSLLSRVPNDWDITTSARPEETAACFSDCRTLDVGIKHGTLTVIMDGMPLEITTYRDDGEYADHRHPVAVTFSGRVQDDLARRDFTVNAMAYHPERGLLDLYEGQTALCERTIACVGDAEKRFSEDGLRILRAIRFAAVLDFTVDPSTARAIHDQKELLHYIAAERIREEFCKLLMGIGAVRILREFRDVIAVFMPEIAPTFDFLQNSRYHCYDVYEHSLRALQESNADLITRLAIYLHDVGKPHTYTEDAEGGHFKGHGAVSTQLARDVLQRLRFDNATISAVVQLVDYHDRDFPAEERAVKRLMCKMSDENILRLMEVQRCDRLAHAAPYNEPKPSVWEIPRLVRRLRAEDACLSLKSLAVTGTDLLTLGYPAGKKLGEMLAELLERVIDGELPNEREALLSYAEKRLP